MISECNMADEQNEGSPSITNFVVLTPFVTNEYSSTSLSHLLQEERSVCENEQSNLLKNQQSSINEISLPSTSSNSVVSTSLQKENVNCFTTVRPGKHKLIFGNYVKFLTLENINNCIEVGIEYIGKDEEVTDEERYEDILLVCNVQDFVNNFMMIPTSSTTVSPATSYFSKVESEAFKSQDKNKLQNVSVCLAYNSMLSLNYNKNKFLIEAYIVDETTKLKNMKIAFYWIPRYYDNNGYIVHYNVVLDHYEKLKENGINAAEQFLAQIEEDTPVPLNFIREYLKGHKKVKSLVRYFREIYFKSNVYIFLADSDTINFNGVLSSYLDIITKYETKFNNLPIVVTTGYEFPKEGDSYGPYALASHVDRAIRIITAKHVPLGVYYPEPNMCVYVPESCSTIPESFLTYRDKIYYGRESPCLLKNIKTKLYRKYEKDKFNFIFSGYDPLITAIPKRAKRMISNSKRFNFSKSFSKGGKPTSEDFDLLAQISQNHQRPKAWLDSLFINGAVVIRNKHLNVPSSAKRTKKKKKGKINIKKATVLNRCKHLIANLKKANVKAERKRIVTELKTYIYPKSVVWHICAAAIEISKYMKEFSEDNIKEFNSILRLNFFCTENSTNIKENEKISPFNISNSPISTLEFTPESLYGNIAISSTSNSNAKQKNINEYFKKQ